MLRYRRFHGEKTQKAKVIPLASRCLVSFSPINKKGQEKFLASSLLVSLYYVVSLLLVEKYIYKNY